MTDKWQFVTFIKTDQKLIIVTLISVSELVQPVSLRGWYLLEAALCAAFFYGKESNRHAGPRQQRHQLTLATCASFTKYAVEMVFDR